MKEEILKLAGTKSLKEFYSKYPSEEDFLKVHGKEFKKLLRGGAIKKAQKGISQFGMDAINNNTNSFDPIYGELPNRELNPSVGNDYSYLDNNHSQTPQGFVNPSTGYQPQQKPDSGGGNSGTGMTDAINKFNPIVGGVMKGIDQFFQEKEQLKSAKQWKGVSDVMLQASQSKPEDVQHKYVRPEDVKNTGEEFFPIYGVGTNVLERGGNIPKAQYGGLKQFTDAGGSSQLSNISAGLFDNNAGATLGQSAGSAVSMIPVIGDVLSIATEPAFTAIGAGLDEAFGPAGKIKKQNKQTFQNIDRMAFGQGAKGIFAQNNQFMRTGGNLRSNMQTEGDLNVYKGNAEPISYNPYSANNGETIMFNGPSHEDGGMPVTYGNNPVEVEGGEPATQMNDNNLVVFGNLNIPKFGKQMIGDDNATGKFKNYIKKLAEKEDRQNKLVEKSTTQIGEMNVITPIDKLTFSSLKANVLGANMKLKDFAAKKENAAHLQNAINETAEELNLSPDHLSKGVVKQAKKGINISKYKFQPGTSTPTELPNYEAPINMGNDYSYLDTTPYHQSLPEDFIMPPARQPIQTTTKETTLMNPYITALNTMLPFIRPSDAEQLDPRQLAGEMYALSNNQLEPVQAQTYQPQLSTPYDISLQDIRNENQSDFRGAQRTMGYNPAAQSILASQKYAANQKIGAEEFRMNQGMKDKTYSENRNTLNDAKLKNLGIYDQQYTRQAEAKSNTKAVTQAALNSISDKFLKNKLENRTLQTYENLYNYRYDDKGRAWNMNPLQQFNTSGTTNLGTKSVPEGYEYIYDKSGQPIDIRKTPKASKETSRNGSIVRAIKNL